MTQRKFHSPSAPKIHLKINYTHIAKVLETRRTLGIPPVDEFFRQKQETQA